MDERFTLGDDGLDIALDVGVERLLGVDDEASVLERFEGTAVGDPARDLVGEDEAEPERELEEEVAPAAGQKPGRAHPAILARDRGGVATRRCTTSRPWDGRPFR